jgi:hypothetical protein
MLRGMPLLVLLIPSPLWTLYFSLLQRRHSSFAGEQSVLVNDEDVIADLMENHQEFIHGMTPRLAKLEVLKEIKIRYNIYRGDL